MIGYKFTHSKFSLKLSIGILLCWLFAGLFSPYLESWLGYGYDNLFLESRLLSPGQKGIHNLHLLGTDALGRDVLAGLIHGARVALIISSTAIILSLCIGMSIGIMIGYYGDHQIRKNLVQQMILYLSLALIIYYLIDIASLGYNLYNVVPIIFIIAAQQLLDRICDALTLKKFGVPLDIIFQRIFEVRESLPGLFLILAIIAIVSKPSIMTVSIIMAILYWITFARHARAETMIIKEETFIKSAIASGNSDAALIINHILPNILPQVAVIIAFSFSGVILLEASLSFLGIGIPLEEVSWGKILAGSRNHPKAWWLAVFPGIAIFLILFAFNTIGDYLSQYHRRDG